MANPLDFLKLMKDAGKMQAMAASQQKKLKKQVFEASGGAGMVKVQINGAFEVLSIKVEPEALDQLGLNSIMDLTRAALNDGIKQVQEGAKNEMMESFKGMSGLFGDEG